MSSPKKHRVTWTPELCKPREGGEYEGTVTIRVPTYDERLFMFADVDDLPKDATEADKRRHNLSIMATVARRGGLFVEAITITRKSDGFVFESFDDLYMDTDMSSVVSEITNRLVGKYAVGNVQPPT